MLNQFLLLDVAPDPVSTGIGITGLILVGTVVLISLAAVLTGFVFLIKRLTKPAGATTHLVVGDACLNPGGPAARSKPVTNQPINAGAQPENSPNQL